MLYLPLDFGEITLDGLVDSGAYINTISWSDYTMIRNNTENCNIKEYPQPPYQNRMRKRHDRTTHSDSWHAIQYRLIHFHRHVCCPLKNALPISRTQLHEESASGTGHSKRHNHIPPHRKDTSHES